MPDVPDVPPTPDNWRKSGGFLQQAFAPAVLIAVVGGAVTTGFFFGSNQNATRISILEIEQQRMRLHVMSHEETWVPRREYELTVGQMAADIAEIKTEVSR